MVCIGFSRAIPADLSITHMRYTDLFFQFTFIHPFHSGGATPLVDVGDIRREAVGGRRRRRRRRRLAPPLPFQMAKPPQNTNIHLFFRDPPHILRSDRISTALTLFSFFFYHSQLSLPYISVGIRSPLWIAKRASPSPFQGPFQGDRGARLCPKFCSDVSRGGAPLFQEMAAPATAPALVVRDRAGAPQYQLLPRDRMQRTAFRIIGDPTGSDQLDLLTSRRVVASMCMLYGVHCGECCEELFNLMIPVSDFRRRSSGRKYHHHQFNTGVLSSYVSCASFSTLQSPMARGALEWFTISVSPPAHRRGGHAELIDAIHGGGGGERGDEDAAIMLSLKWIAAFE
ncbi:hypothetical protein EVAR_34188_1 [Eumeta japonica]|uniref:Uncharacterized protein n=1 Tax=Eumeta variegata TaxID=151549 RepID=A0A4C1WIJ8_EUMVA|nr:hypothetical protein EVAR_34188_1 [Eumeta japonica]